MNNKSKLRDKEFSKLKKKEGPNYPYSWDENACRPQNMNKNHENLKYKKPFPSPVHPHSIKAGPCAIILQYNKLSKTQNLVSIKLLAFD
jgi:hypothetical protein